MNRNHVRGAALAFLLAAGACGDSATDVVGDLTRAEAAALAEVVAGTVVSTFDQAGPMAGPALGPALATFNQQVSFEGPCELGGTMAVTGDLDIVTDDETEELTSLEYTVTQVHNGCVGESQDGMRFTLTGAPNVTATFLVQTEGESVAMDGSYSGAVDWSTEGKSGTCTLSVEFSVNVNFGTETGTANMAGTVCGVSFSESVSVS